MNKQDLSTIKREVKMLLKIAPPQPIPADIEKYIYDTDIGVDIQFQPSEGFNKEIVEGLLSIANKYEAGLSIYHEKEGISVQIYKE